MMDNNFINGYQTRRHRRKSRLAKFLVIIFIGATMMYFTYNHFKKNETKVLSETVTPLAATEPSIGTSAATSPSTVNTSLKAVVENSLEGTKGTYGIVVKDIKTGEIYSANEHKVFEAGSLYKLWIMAVVYNKIQSGELKENQILSQDISVLNDKFNIDPELAEQTSGTITFSVNIALKQMITISHNYAALLLTEKIRLSSVATFLKQNGFSESKVGTEGDVPITAPSDMALFFEKLYQGELANQEYTNKMLDLLKNQQLKDKLPKYLPPDTAVAHKTGEIGFFSHDAGIVYSPKGDYIIVILSESNSPPGAEDRIAEVSQAVYNYFNGKD